MLNLGKVEKKYTKSFHAGLKEINISCHKLSQNDDFVSKYPSSVAAILKPRFLDHVTPIFQLVPISGPGP